MVDSIHTGSLKFCASPPQSGDSKKAYKIHKILGKYIIVISNELRPTEDTWYTQELQFNGDILLRKRILEQ